MSARDDGNPGQEGLGGLCVASPQDRHERPAASRESLNGARGDCLPTATPVASRSTWLDGQHPVEQQDALLEPGAEVTVGRWWDTEIGIQFPVKC